MQNRCVCLVEIFSSVACYCLKMSFVPLPLLFSFEECDKHVSIFFSSNPRSHKWPMLVFSSSWLALRFNFNMNEKYEKLFLRWKSFFKLFQQHKKYFLTPFYDIFPLTSTSHNNVVQFLCFSRFWGKTIFFAAAQKNYFEPFFM